MLFRHSMNMFKYGCAATAGLLLSVAVARGQFNADSTRGDPGRLVASPIDNGTGDWVRTIVGVVESPGAATIRAHIRSFHLGRASYVTLTSVADGDVQWLDVDALARSYNWSAAFNGSAVEVELHVAPGEGGVFVQIDGLRPSGTFQAGDGSIASICGANDDRVAFGDSRIGRTTQGCTAWLVSNGAVLTAGHCSLAAGDVVEFNVPLSTVNGNTMAAAVVDQYPINIATIVSENVTAGQDWQVFALNANTLTGRTAHQVQGFFRMTKGIPGNGTVVRVTGYGLDNAPAGTGASACVGGTNHNGGCVSNANCPGGGTCTGPSCCDPDGTGPLPCSSICNSATQTLQTATGALINSNVNLILHNADTMPANSGSPIIWEANGLTIGIHTSGGCTPTAGNNAGTRFSRPVLETAIRNFAGPNPIYVDASNYDLPSNGGVFEPFHNIAQAVAAVPDGGTISLVPGFYSRQDIGNTFTAGADGKAMTFVSPAGSSFIGS